MRENESKCVKCGGGDVVKNGFVDGVQRYKCKQCGYQFTALKPHGHGDEEKRAVVLLYACGLTVSEIAGLTDVSVQTVSRWIKAYYSEKRAELAKMTPMRHGASGKTTLLSMKLDGGQTVNVVIQKEPSGAP